jgi:hypothetical protein
LNHVKLPKEICSFDLGKKHVRKAEEFKKNAERSGKLLLSLTETAKKRFSEEHDFENIKTVKDFQERVPVRIMKILNLISKG